MKTHRWRDVRRKAGMSDKDLAEIARRKDEILTDVTLRRLREMAGVTQEELARRLEASQSQLSQVESREDHKLSTLRRYVEALGGKIRVQAVLKGKTVELVGV